ncbi:MAG: hypothetical protein K2L95_03910 [Alphaproteobacteria bacterium]|nr:hypothetical protein [Alphaproteobacteria bacterium]
MPKYPNITVTLPKNADNADIVMACLQAMKAHNIGNELEQFARDIEKGGPAHLRQTAEKWFNIK